MCVCVCDYIYCLCHRFRCHFNLKMLQRRKWQWRTNKAEQWWGQCSKQCGNQNQAMADNWRCWEQKILLAAICTYKCVEVCMCVYMCKYICMCVDLLTLTLICGSNDSIISNCATWKQPICQLQQIQQATTTTTKSNCNRTISRVANMKTAITNAFKQKTKKKKHEKLTA